MSIEETDTEVAADTAAVADKGAEPDIAADTAVEADTAADIEVVPDTGDIEAHIVSGIGESAADIEVQAEWRRPGEAVPKDTH
jgi:hypothetical protein